MNRQLIHVGLVGVAIASLVLTTNVILDARAAYAGDGGLEISGAVDVVGGWQHDDQDATGTGGSLGGLSDYDGGAAIGNLSNADHFRMVVNQVEIDLAKTFGENIRLRADIDIINLTNTTGVAGLSLEQAYVTANLSVGNGIEFLMGSFNAPVGVELVDTRDNWFVSYAHCFRHMTPANVTGVKLYYAFSDLVDFHFAVVNDLNDNGFGDSALPSELFRLGFNWGQKDGNKNTVGISGGVGPESDAAVNAVAGPQNSHFDFFVDLDILMALSSTVTMAGEAVYRQSDSVTGGINQKALAGMTAVKYQINDVWDISWRAGYLWEINPVAGFNGGSSGASTTGTTWNGGFEGALLSGTMGVGYLIADGAKMKLEYRYDWARAGKNGQANSDAQSILAQLAYAF